MITKENLLDMLRKSVSNEDEFISQYGKTVIEKIHNCVLLASDEKDKIGKLLKAILDDTNRHREIIASLIQDVETGTTSEY